MDMTPTPLFTLAYGSHLYGTNTPTSDYDYKTVYLPAFRDVLLGRKLPTFKVRVDATGAPVADNQPMPDGGTETEFVPLQTFCRDFLNGQTYALELAFARLQQPECEPWVKELVEKFTTCNVSSMAGFAMKQTFDYVHRGVRLEKARALLAVLTDLLQNVGTQVTLRLDTPWAESETHLDEVVRRTGCELGTTVNNGREMRTLKLNGRDYLETTTVEHLRTAVQKLVDSYGHRTAAAAEAEVDRKSLMHAVRVYQQALELLQTGRMRFPRVNVKQLLHVKTTQSLEEVKALLLNLEASLEATMETAKVLPAKTPEMEAEFEAWLLKQLVQHYKLVGVSFA